MGVTNQVQKEAYPYIGCAKGGDGPHGGKGGIGIFGIANGGNGGY